MVLTKGIVESNLNRQTMNCYSLYSPGTIYTWLWFSDKQNRKNITIFSVAGYL